MANIKLTKTALKGQRDDLKRFSRFLPTLQLKKQQLQVEVQTVRDEIKTLHTKLDVLVKDAQKWIELFSTEGFNVEVVSEQIVIDKMAVETRNIAGVDVPFFAELSFKPVEFDLFSTPSWYDGALDYVRQLLEMSKREEVMRERLSLLERELQVTNQRVNLFEKVKIPECNTNIRMIRIYLGDQETAAVGRSKIAKRKMQVVAS
ncbi:MAG: V-type ATP synthase subunit D [Lentisphaeria bacterium]|nr:V-type ATP synthase subunit D [Lentisphaeria bacterium]